MSSTNRIKKQSHGSKNTDDDPEVLSVGKLMHNNREN
jgi:hypothetical protein